MSISPTFFVVSLAACLAMIRLQGVLLPDSLYFSFSAFLFDNRDLNRPLALLTKLAVPFLLGFVGLWVTAWLHAARVKAVGTAGEIDRVLREQADVTLMAAAFAAAFLLAWPYILLWDLLIDPQFHRFRLLYLIAYTGYCLGFAYFALAGANTARAVLNRAEPRPPITLATLVEHPLLRPVANAATGALTTAVAAFLASRASAP